MTRWTLVVGVVLLAVGGIVVALARALGHSGSRPSVLVSVIASWLAAYVLWGFAGGLAVRYELLAIYDAPLFGVLAVAGAVWQYRTQVRRGSQRGLTVFVAGQLIWLLIVMARNGALGN